jgi:predicted amidohydrolase YtcJ
VNAGVSGGARPGAAGEESGLVLLDARLTGGAEPVDVLLENGRIAAVGPGAAATADRGHRRLRLDGRVVVPGLWDNHVHFTQWTLARRRINLEAARSAAEAARLVAAAGAGTSYPGMPVVGYGFRDALWPDAPSLPLLDAALPDTAIVLLSGDLHSCWLNSAALHRYGYAGATETGLLREEDAFEVVRRIDQVPEDALDAWAREAAAAAAARGVVGVVDLEMTWNLDTWTRRAERGHRDLRVEFGTYRQDLDRAVSMGLRSGSVVDGTRGLVSVGPFKVITDGSLNTRTAYCADEYPGGSTEHPRGVLTVPTADLVEWMTVATRAGLGCAVHAIGDEANTLALDAFAATGARGSIEHAQLLSWADVPRFAELGVVASLQPDHALDDRDVADAYWAGRTDRAFVLASLTEAGATIALGSDAPVSPLDPWLTMAAAVWRTRDGLPPWHPEQAISVRAALAASTRGASVTPGAVADLAVLDADPFTAGLDAFRTMPVAATLLAGRLTHDAL